MMRSLWTSAAGMSAQQTSIDNISNNISNVNTNAYKKSNLEFKDLLYTNLKKTVVDNNGDGSPVSLQVGSGVRVGSTTKDFSTGTISKSGNNLDFAVQGEGFFRVLDARGNERYTKDGTFKISPFDGENYLVTSEGYKVLNSEGEAITFASDIKTSTISVDEYGNFGYVDDTGAAQELGITFGMVQFTNVLGLESTGDNLYKPTAASGEIIYENELEDAKKSVIRQGCVEMSNVQIAEEMVNMIVTQRAYELNSKAIQTSDDMLSIANQLKR